MRKTRLIALLLFSLLVGFRQIADKKILRVFLIGDSTVADYTIYDDYKTKRYPITGWGQVFQAFMSSDSLGKVRNIIKADSVLVIDSARATPARSAMRLDAETIIQPSGNRSSPKRFFRMTGATAFCVRMSAELRSSRNIMPRGCAAKYSLLGMMPERV